MVSEYRKCESIFRRLIIRGKVEYVRLVGSLDICLVLFRIYLIYLDFFKDEFVLDIVTFDDIFFYFIEFIGNS